MESKKEYQIMHFGIKSQGEGQGGCKSKCLHPEVERGRSGMSHAAPVGTERVQYWFSHRMSYTWFSGKGSTEPY